MSKQKTISIDFTEEEILKLHKTQVDLIDYLDALIATIKKNSNEDLGLSERERRRKLAYFNTLRGVLRVHTRKINNAAQTAGIDIQ